MENEETPNLNTEPNDIAGNRLDGPVGNTAAKPGRPGAGAGIPGGPPRASAESGEGDIAPAAPATELPAARTAAPGNSQPPAGPAAPAGPAEAYGGNFSNSTQGSYRDADRRENQDSDPNRGEFGAQDLGGTTHGGFGNQDRRATYEPRGSAEDRYYGGPGAPGPQDNAYRAYDGRDERPDGRSASGFEPGAPPADGAPARGSEYEGTPGDNRNQPDRADPASAHQNDNGSAPGPDRGYAPDYGHTSLPMAGAPTPDLAPDGLRNQTEDYLPAPHGSGPQGRRAEPQPSAGDAPGQRPASSPGYGDRGREEPRRAPDFDTGSERTGYVQASGGDAAQGVGSRGGSYNDAYDDSKPGSPAGSPAQGDQRREDTDASYGQAAREENRAQGDDSADHGAPRRNAGRDGEADE